MIDLQCLVNSSGKKFRYFIAMNQSAPMDNDIVKITFSGNHMQETAVYKKDEEGETEIFLLF